MKTYLSIALLMLSSMYLQAQVAIIKVPGYTKGVYAYDTIYNYSGPMPFASLPAHITIRDFKFVTGLKFYVLLEGTGSRYDSSTGQWGPINKDEKLSSPIMFRGGTAFHLIIEGTPEIASETYPCELTNTHTLGEEFGVIFFPREPEKTCVVDLIKGIDSGGEKSSFSIYPNPTSDNLFIRGNLINAPYIIYDALGRIQLSGILKDAMQEVDIHNLSPGNYLIQIGSEQQTLKFVKK